MNGMDFCLLLINMISLCFCQYYSPSNMTISLNITQTEGGGGALLECFSSTNSGCTPSSPYAVINSSWPLHFFIDPSVISPGVGITGAVLSITLGICSTIDDDLLTPYLNLSINDWSGNLNFTQQNICLQNQTITLNTGPDLWNFWIYPNYTSTTPDCVGSSTTTATSTTVTTTTTPTIITQTLNQITLFSEMTDYNFIVFELVLTLQTVKVEPCSFVTVQVDTINPWSLQNGQYSSIEIGLDYYNRDFEDSNGYHCKITYQDLEATGRITASTYMQTGFWLVNCVIYPQTEVRKFNYGILYDAFVFVAPDLPGDPPPLIDYQPLSISFCEQPTIYSISPSRIPPNTTVMVSGVGFSPQGLNPTLQIFSESALFFIVNEQQYMYNYSDTTIIFTLPELYSIQSTRTLCVRVSPNDQDFTICTEDSEFVYWLGETPSSPSVFEEIIEWLNKNWWSYILIAGVALSLLLLGCSFIRSSSKNKDVAEEEEDEEDAIEDKLEIDSRALININELSIREMIGSGSFAVVYRGYWRKTEVAIKMLQNHVKNDKMTFLKESSLMLSLRHPNVVSLMGIVWNPRLCIITEYCCRGDVSQVMLNKKFIVEPDHVRRICLDTCRGMTYLHGANVIHRDLKSRNLLIDKDWNVKVADFGLARAFDETPGTMTACGTPTHAAPEVIRHLHYTSKADVYSFGICLWEMCVRQEPYDSLPGFQVIVAVATKKMRPKIPPTLDHRWSSLIRRCWTEDPQQRPQFQDLVEIFEEMKLPTPPKKMPYKEEDLTKKSSTGSRLTLDVSRENSTEVQMDSKEREEEENRSKCSPPINIIIQEKTNQPMNS